MQPRLPAQALLELIEHRRFGVEYQPVVSVANGSVFGHEALARFYDSNGEELSPQLVFDSLHASPLSLFQVEYEMKQLQLAHAPHDAPRLFVNLDPDAFQAGSCGADSHPLVTLLSKRQGVVVEIIENSNINDADISAALVAAFSGSSVELALDDIGAPRTMLSLSILLTVDFLKLDRSWLHSPNDPVHCAALRHLIGFARECGKRTILEGVESESHLAFARDIGVDCVQGFLFRDDFRRTGCLARQPPLPEQRRRYRGLASGQSADTPACSSYA